MKRPPEPDPADSPTEREPDNAIAMEGEPMKSDASPTPPPPAPQDDRTARQNLSMIDYLVARQAQESEPRLWLKCVAEVNWERLQLARWLEDKVHMPLKAADTISGTIIKAAEAASRAELAASARHKQLGTRAMETFDSITIDGVLVNPPATAQQVKPPPVAATQARPPAPAPDAPVPASEASTDALPPVNPHLPPDLQERERRFRQLTVEDRMLLGTALDEMVHIIRLKKEQRAAQNFNTASEEEKSG